MRIFITGGAGFIGSHLSQYLLQQGHSVTAYDNLSLGREDLLSSCKSNSMFKFIKGDLLDLALLRGSLRGHDLVYHLAANSDIAQGAKVTDVDLRNGTLATYNTLEAMRLEGVSEMVFASTSAIYGEAEIKPTPEHYGPLFPISFYGASKLACEGLCTAFSHNYGIKIWAYRFANIVGSHATHGVIHDFVDRLKKEPKVLQVLGNGTQRKSYLHVSDCIAGMEFGRQRCSEQFQLFNLASHGVSNVRFIANTVASQMATQLGVTADIVFGEGERGWRGDVPYTHLDGSKLAALGWNAKYSSDEALQVAIAEIVSEKLSPVGAK